MACEWVAKYADDIWLQTSVHPAEGHVWLLAIGHLSSLTSLSCRASRPWPQRCSLWRRSTHAGTCRRSSGAALSSSACSALRRPCWIPPVATRWVTAKPLDAHWQHREELLQPEDGTTSSFHELCTSAQAIILTHLPLCPIWSCSIVSVPFTCNHRGSQMHCYGPVMAS